MNKFQRGYLADKKIEDETFESCIIVRLFRISSFVI